MSCARSILIAMFITGSLAPDALAAGKWTRLRTAHFLLIGDASEREIRQVAQRIEDFREALIRTLPNAAVVSPVPIVVMVFDTDRSFDPFKPKFKGKTVQVAGYFTAGEDVNYVALALEAGEPAYRTVFHEYTHFVLNNTAPSFPLWFAEGLAEFYETFEQQDGGKGVVIGRPSSEQILALRGQAFLPLEELVAVDPSSPIYNEEGRRRGIFYAESWALVHYLAQGKRAPELGAYMSRLDEGMPPPEAFRAAFRDPATLERELREYVRHFLFPVRRWQFNQKLGGTTTEVAESMPEPEAQAYLADLLAHMDRTEDARARLESILKSDPRAARAYAGLGWIELRAKRVDEAVALFERGAALAPDDAPIQTALGRSLVDRLQQKGAAAGADTETIDKARRVLSHAIDLDPNAANAMAALGFVEFAAGANLDRSRSLFERAIRLAPARENYRLMLAQVQIRQRDYPAAQAQLGALAARGSTSEVKGEARNLLSRLARAQAGSSARHN